MSGSRFYLNGVSLLALTLLVAAPAAAQDAAQVAVQDAAQADGAVTELKKITITGEKVERDLKNTASSVTVETSEEIEREKVGDASVSEVIADVPNVVFPDSVSAPVIRGQDTQGPNTGATAFFAGTVPRATINVDGHYLTYNEFYFGSSSVWDVNTIEVFRGPQTTSQGANAIAGAIVVNTKDPAFTPEGAYQAEIGSYNTRRASAVLSGPLIANQLAARLAVDYSGRDTFIDYVNSGFQGNGTNQNFEAFNTRFKLLWEPEELPGLTAKFTYAYTFSNRPSQEAASAPYKDLNHVTTTMPTWDQYTHYGVLDLGYDFGNGWQVFNKAHVSDTYANRTTGVVNNGDAGVWQTNVSDEMRVTYGDQEDVISGMAGIYYSHSDQDEILYLSGISTFDDTKQNLGIFGETSYRMTDRLTLTGGLRFQNDIIQRQGLSVYAPTRVDFDKTFTAVLPKATLAYAVTPDWTVGGMVSRGYNPGGVSLNISARKWMTFEEETSWNYELFTRASLLDNRLMVNGNVFYSDLKNAQYNIPVVISSGVTQSYTINAEKAHSYGLEVGADYKVLDNLMLRASAGLLKTRIDEISSNASYEGNEFAKSPGYMLTFGLSWDVTDKLNLSGQVRHLDGYFSDTANTAAYAIDPYTVADVRATYQLREAFQLYGYVKNVFDERSPTYMQQNRGIGGTEASMTEPRMFGIGIKGTF